MKKDNGTKELRETAVSALQYVYMNAPHARRKYADKSMDEASGAINELAALAETAPRPKPTSTEEK